MDEDEEGEEDDDDNEDDEEEEEEEEKEDGVYTETNRGATGDISLAKALEMLFGLLITLSTEEVIDGRPASTLLVYFSGMLGFSADLVGFLPARIYTSNLAGLIYVQRLLFLEYALSARAYPFLGIP